MGGTQWCKGGTGKIGAVSAELCEQAKRNRKISRATIATAPTMGLDPSGSCVLRPILPGDRQSIPDRCGCYEGSMQAIGLGDVATNGPSAYFLNVWTAMVPTHVPLVLLDMCL